MATSDSDSFLVFIRSSLHFDFNFVVLVSSHDDIASLKKKAEAIHYDLFPHCGRIVAKAIKIIQNGVQYPVQDSCPVICFLDSAKGTCSFLMDAILHPPIPPPSPHAHIFHFCDASNGSYSAEGGGNSSCTSESLKRKSLEYCANKDSVVEEELIIEVDLGQCAPDKGNKKSKDSSDEVLTCTARESPKRGDQSRENNVSGKNETIAVHLKRDSSPAGCPGDASSDRDLIEEGCNPNCTSLSLQKKFLEDNASKDRAAEEEVTLRVGVLGQCARDKGNLQKSKDPSSVEVLTCNERGDQIREICVASENETSGVHLMRVTSLAGSPELLSEDMPLYSTHSFGHLAEQLSCIASDKGKAKFHPSSSSSCSGYPSPNYKRPETHTRLHGLTIHEACTTRLHSRAIRVENLGKEERKGPHCEKYMTMEEPVFTSEDPEDEIARVNQIKSDEILARSLQDEFNQEHQTPDESDEEADCFTEHFLSQERFLKIPECRRAQMRFSGPEMDHENLLISRLLHEFEQPQVDDAKKKELLDELIVTYESHADTEVYDGFDFYHDLFYDEDENVVMLDQTVGATESQINHLPVSEIQESNEDACIICLDTPSIGSVMRHLPCLHRFHKECVDKWLLIKNSCPVCKLAIDWKQ